MTAIRTRLAGGFVRLAALLVVQAAFGIALARLLPPEAFGTALVLGFWAQALAGIAGLGLDQALARRDCSKPDAGAALILHGLAGAALAMVLLGPAAAAVHAPAAFHPWAAAAGLLALARQVPVARLERALRFREIARAEWAAAIAAQGLAITMAWRGCGAASLVAAMILREAVLTACAWRLAGKDLAAAAPRAALLAEGLPFLGTGLIALASASAVPLWMAGRLGSAEIGYLAWAAGLALKPQQLVDLSGRLLYPALARIREDAAAVGRATEEALCVTATALLAWAVLLAVLSEPVIRLVYGEKWLPAQGALVLYALALVPILANLTAVKALLALGEARRLLGISAATTAVLWGILLAPLPHLPALWAAPLALAAANLAGFLMTGPLLSRRVPISWWRGLRTPAIAAAAAGLCAWAVHNSMPGWAGLLAGGAAGVAACLAVLAASPERPLATIRELVTGAR